MQYTILINQRAVIEMGLDLDINDMAIFNFIQGFSNYGKCIKAKINEEDYFCLSTDLIERELPMLNLKRRAIYERVNKLISAGLLKRCDDNKSAHRTFLRFGERYGEYMGYAAKCTTMHENAQPAMQQNAHEQIIYNNNIYNNINKGESPKALPVNKIYISSTERAALLNNPDKIAELKREKFIERTKDAAAEVGMSKEQYDAFVDYYTAHNDGSEKLECETKDIFDKKKRMKTWMSRSYKQKPSPPVQQERPKALTFEEIDNLYK